MDVLVDLLRERRPALDRSSLESLVRMLGNLFWADLERANPRASQPSRCQPRPARNWKQRLRTIIRSFR